MKTTLTRFFVNLNFIRQLVLALFLMLQVSSCEQKDSDEEVAEEIVAEDNDSTTVITEDTEDVVTYDKIYIPNELSSNDFYESSSQWYYGRSQQSDHFIVFWDTEYGDNDPNSDEIEEAYQVDIDDLLEKAEGFYDMNINTLGFAEVGVGSSNLDTYKMMIFIYYQTDWLATGSGYDNVIGALWVSPGTCKPVGSVIAHEIGHSFQYQVFCDLGGTSGYRYGFGGNGGNAFWEQCAQWQSYQSYPVEAFSSSNFSVYLENCHRHFCHEWQRYASYWLQYYWTDKHGADMIGKLWREAESPEDPIETYMRITGITVSQFNDEFYDAATKFVTWDLDAIRSNGEDYIDQYSYSATRQDDGSYIVDYSKAPSTAGYNVIKLDVPDAGTTVSIEFTGLYNPDGFNTMDNVADAGWRYGYVALLENGQRVYGDMNSSSSAKVDFTIPEGIDKLWFVVTGAPDTYESHAWDEDETNDAQWPYQLSFTNTSIFGDISFDGTEVAEDIDFTFDISFPATTEGDYTGTSVTLSDELVDLAYAFVLKPSEISDMIGDEITFYAVESDGTLNAQTTANGYGHWFDADGDVISWGTDAMVFSEFDASNFIFTVGQYPDHLSSGDTYSITQALVYDNSGTDVTATFTFNITIE